MPLGSPYWVNFLQSVHCSSIWVRPEEGEKKKNEIVRQVCPQFRLGCQRVPIIRHPSVDAWRTIDILMYSHVEDVLQRVHRQVSNAGSFDPPFWR